MENNKIFCSECGTENEEKYDYCKNCGAKLERAENITKPNILDNEQYTQTSQQSEDYTYYQNNGQTTTQKNFSQNDFGDTFVETINGIPYGEVAVFVGKKAQKYMPVFSKLEITGGKTAWHWPCAILSFLFGPIGAALWFFYRKMYKIALILSAIGIVLTVAAAIIIGPSAESMDALDIILGFAEPENLDAATVNEAVLRSEIANSFTSIFSLACAIVCGLFTHGWYKEHIHNEIIKYRSSNVDMRYYQMGLMSVGGTSGGMLALGIAIMVFAEYILAIIYAALSILN